MVDVTFAPERTVGSERFPDGQATLLPAGEHGGHFQRLAVAGNLYLDFVAGLFGAQSVGEIVEILNRLAVEFRHDVAPLESGLGGGGGLPHRGGFYARDALRGIGDA